MTQDKNKGITNVKYNHLNLPVEIVLSSGKINYIYNADGVRLSKQVQPTGGMLVTTDYLNGFQYENNVLQFFPHAEGYVKPNGTNSYLYAYQYKDHLGNVRLSYADINGNGTIEPATEILEENNYYPFGLLHKGYNEIANTNRSEAAEKYKFGGKEWNDELGLNFYDFGARNYDPALGRWMNIDPLAEDSRRWTPYNYAYNNPIVFVDPDGMQAVDPKSFDKDALTFNNGYYDIEFGEFAGAADHSGFYSNSDYKGGGNNTLSLNTSDSQIKQTKQSSDTSSNSQGAEGNGSGNPKKSNKSLQQHRKEAVNLKEWIKIYRYFSQRDIALERGKDKYGLPLGPSEKYRYVINPYDNNVMDMRHVVVVGYGMGEVNGLGAELIQYAAGLFGKDPTNSAFNAQDKYSNNIGNSFRNYDYSKNGVYMSYDFAQRFGEFLKTVYNK